MRRISRATRRRACLAALLTVCTVAFCLPLGASGRGSPSPDRDRFGRIVLSDTDRFAYLTENDSRP